MEDGKESYYGKKSTAEVDSIHRCGRSPSRSILYWSLADSKARVFRKRTGIGSEGPLSLVCKMNLYPARILL